MSQSLFQEVMAAIMAASFEYSTICI